MQISNGSGKAFFDNLKRGVEQIEASDAEVGCVAVGFRNLLDHSQYWPLLNEDEYRAGDQPIFGAFREPDQVVGPALFEQVQLKQSQVVEEIGAENVLKIFDGRESLACISRSVPNSDRDCERGWANSDIDSDPGVG